MAIYTYFCPKCNRRFDIFYGKEQVECDVCQNRDVVKVFTAPMIKTRRRGEEGASGSCGSCVKTTCSGCK